MPHAMPAHAELCGPIDDRTSLDQQHTSLADPAGADTLWGESEPMQRLRRALERVAPTRANVLLVGECGTGKSLAAQYLHRSEGPGARAMASVDCGATETGQLDARLFGAEGVFERDEGGTVFIDNVGRLPGALQSKLLRALDADAGRHTWRVLAATDRDLGDAVNDGSLRPDLLYRLAEFPLRVPPLRERGKDIERLAERFVDALNATREQQKRLSAESRLCLYEHDWPGNVRELKNAVHCAWLLAERELMLSKVDLQARAPCGDNVAVPIGTSIADMERALIMATLARCDGNKRHAADILGVSLKTL
jgi:two-component system response regulator AtoC